MYLLHMYIFEEIIFIVIFFKINISRKETNLYFALSVLIEDSELFQFRLHHRSLKKKKRFIVEFV